MGGYGHIGSQLSVLAEAMGMNVIYYDVVTLMALGTARQVPTLDDLLNEADFVTLHVPDLPETRNMISTKQFEQMKTGAYLFNATLNSWGDELRNLNNIILTPHIGGSTEEAQRAIGIEVSEALVRYINQGITLGSVNLPEVQLRSLTLEEENTARVIYIHKNVPGVLRRVNEILGDHNVDKQISDNRGDVAYLMADISKVQVGEIKDLYESLEGLSSRILTRVLY